MASYADISSRSPAKGADAAGPRKAASPIVAALAIGALALAWTFVVRLPLRRMDGLDDAFYAEVAHLWTQGILPYAGAFDIKPPGFFALLAVVQMLLGPTLDSLRAIAIGGDAVAAAALVYLGRRFNAPMVGVCAGALYPVLSELVTSNDAYCPLGALTILAFLAALSSLDVVKRAVLAGALIGAAVVVKQTGGFEAIALLFVFASAPDVQGRRARVALIFVVTAALAPAGFLLYFAAHGAAQPLIDDAVLGALIRPASAAEGLTLLGGFGRYFVLQKSVVAIYALACLALLRRRTLRDQAPGVPIVALEAWFLAGTLSILAQRAIAPTYLGPTLAPGLLLAGLCLTRAAPELARMPTPARLAALAIASIAFALAIPGNDLSARQETAALDAAAAAIRASGPASDDKLYVVNRGAWLYPMTDLPPATKYFYPGHTLCNFRESGPGLLADILASLPRYLVVADRRIHYACEQKDRWPIVDAALARSYRRIARAVGTVDSYDVFERTGALP